MNKDQRRRLAVINEALLSLHGDITNIQEEEQEKFDNMPDSLQQSERGQAIEEAAQALDEIASLFDEITDKLSELS